MSFVTFVAEIAVAIPAKNRLGAIEGIEGKLVSSSFLEGGKALRL